MTELNLLDFKYIAFIEIKKVSKIFLSWKNYLYILCEPKLNSAVYNVVSSIKLVIMLALNFLPSSNLSTKKALAASKCALYPTISP